MAKIIPTASLMEVLHAPLGAAAWAEIETAAVINVPGSDDLQHLVYAFRIFLKHAIPAAIEHRKRSLTAGI